MGIAVGMATNIPPHNLGELVDALQVLLAHENPDMVTIEELMDFIHGPACLMCQGRGHHLKAFST